MCGDATNLADYVKVLDGRIPNLLITDPPYGIGKAIDGDDRKGDDLDGFNMAWLAVAVGVLAEDSAAVVFSSTRTLPSVLDAARAGGLEFLRLLTLYKPNDETFPWRGWLLKSEAILAMAKGKPRYREVHPYAHDTYIHNHGARSLADDVGHHPAVKPFDVVRDLIARHEGEVVLDCFMGAGTTLLAANAEGRLCVGLEIDAGFCDVIARRFQANTGEKPVLEATGEPHDFLAEVAAT